MSTIEKVRGETEVPSIIVDHRGIIAQVNERFERVFGWRAQEIIGKPLATIIPPTLHDAHHLGFSRFLTTGKPTLLNRPLKLRAVTKAGREFDAEHIITAEQQHGQWVFGATIRPLGDPS